MTKIDSRIVKTQEKLFDAYLCLLEQKAPEQISVQELTTIAQIHRVTFYKHFTNMESFHIVFVDSHILALYRFLEPLNYQPYTKGFEYDCMLQLLTYIQEHAPTYKVLLTSPFIPEFSQQLLQFFQQKVAQHTEELALFDFPGTNVHHDIVAWYGVSALVGTMLMWVRHDFPYTAQELAQSIRKLNGSTV